jgi:hypothetical protein
LHDEHGHTEAPQPFPPVFADAQAADAVDHVAASLEAHLEQPVLQEIDLRPALGKPGVDEQAHALALEVVP